MTIFFNKRFDFRDVTLTSDGSNPFQFCKNPELRLEKYIIQDPACRKISLKDIDNFLLETLFLGLAENLLEYSQMLF